MAHRTKIKRHKQVKRCIAAQKFKAAERELDAERHMLIYVLKWQKLSDAERDAAEYRLTRNTALFAELYIAWGKPLHANKWFRKALKHTERSEDPIIELRLLRVWASYKIVLGTFDDADELFNQVVSQLEALRGSGVLATERLELEITYTKGLKAHGLLLANPLDQEARDQLVASRLLLRGCNKPRYELTVLMACIDVKAWSNPLNKRLLLARAFELNARHVQNVDYFVRISNATTIVPVASLVRGTVRRLEL